MIEFPQEHSVFEVICISCLRRWISCVPSQTLLKQLQCPNCLKQGFVIKTGQEIMED